MNMINGKASVHWQAALRQAVQRKAPELIQALRDDRAGIRRLSSKRRDAARMILSKVMTEGEIEKALAAPPAGVLDCAADGRG